MTIDEEILGWAMRRQAKKDMAAYRAAEERRSGGFDHKLSSKRPHPHHAKNKEKDDDRE